MNNVVFRETMENVKKHRNNNRKKKKLFSIRTKLSCYKVFHRTSISNRNEKKKKKEKNRDTYEQTCPFRTLNTRIK